MVQYARLKRSIMSYGRVVLPYKTRVIVDGIPSLGIVSVNAGQYGRQWVSVEHLEMEAK